MHDATLCLLVKENQNKINEVCLAMKKRGFGAGLWNGTGGKVNSKKGELIKEAMVREVREEFDIKVKKFIKVAILKFTFPYISKEKDYDQIVHVYLAKEWEGDPKESEEMKPKWFKIKDIPYDSMWADDIYWLPKVLEGNLIKADFKFTEDNKVLHKKVLIVKRL